MSAPNTNVKEQEKKHRTPLRGMLWGVVFALILLAALIIYLSFSGNTPADGEPLGAQDGVEQSEAPAAE